MTTPSRQPIVAIDGPAGAGKSTASRMLADRLGFIFIDTGAMYRAVALLSKRQGISWEDAENLGKIAQEAVMEFRHEDDGTHFWLNGVEEGSNLRTPDISIGSSKVARWKEVIEALADKQREIGKAGGVVMEGRNIGTAVFPDAEVKIFLTATPETRAKRRIAQHQARNENVDYETLLQEIKERDARDAGRAHAPLSKAPDAIEFYTDDYTLDEVVDKLVAMVQQKQK